MQKTLVSFNPIVLFKSQTVNVLLILTHILYLCTLIQVFIYSNKILQKYQYMIPRSELPWNTFVSVSSLVREITADCWS